MNKPVDLGLSILEISKIVMHEFWYDYVKPKYGEKTKLCYMDTESFIVYIKTEDIYSGIANVVESRFDASNYELDEPLSKGKHKKGIGSIKDEFSGKIMKGFAAIRAKTLSYLADNNHEDKKI